MEEVGAAVGVGQFLVVPLDELVGDDEACRWVSDVGEVGEYVGEQVGSTPGGTGVT